MISTSETPKHDPTPVPRPVAVIDIGTTSIRMAIAEIDDSQRVRTLETLSQAVSLGKDAFTKGRINPSTIEDCARVLKSYRRLLREYGIVNSDQIRIVATSAVREAANRLAFIDRIYIATGLQVEPLEEAEVARTTFLGIQQYLRAEPQLAQGTTLVAEVGGGNTEILVVRRGNVVFSHVYRLGSLRLRKTLEAFNTSVAKERSIMERHIEKTVEEINDHVPRDEPLELITLGSDMRYAATQLVPEWHPQSLARLPTPAVEQLANRMLGASVDQIVRRHHLSFPDAETIGPSLLTYVRLARTFDCPHLLVADTNLRDGLLREMAVREWTEELSSQIVRSALELARRFHVDESHARQVAYLCKLLFQELAEEHQLHPRYEIVLYVAALLYQVGMYISSRSNHKHAMYIIRNSELFGLSNQDVLLVALVARYHRRASPQPDHEGYATLDRDRRVEVAKMAALLRVAIALDDSRSQRIKEIRCSRERGRLVISVPNLEDLSLEELALRQSGSLFEETFGMPVLLRPANE